jgi:hypothetical protein
MQLWTHHPSGFRLDRLPLPLDPRRRQYWNDSPGPNFCYRTVAPLLWDLLKTDQFLWCCTIRGQFKRPSEDIDLVEWELNVPPQIIIAHVRVPVWEDLIWGRIESWDGLILKDTPNEGRADINALVAVPLPPGCVKCHGQLPPHFTRKDEERARRVMEAQKTFDPKITAEYDWDG